MAEARRIVSGGLSTLAVILEFATRREHGIDHRKRL